GIPLVSKDPAVNFSSQLRSKGINLSQEEVDLVKQYNYVSPTGEWAAENNQSLINNNFSQFKDTFIPNGPKDVNEYHRRAISFANSNNLYARYYFDINYYQQKNKVLVIKWDIQTSEFIIIHLDGTISNYQRTDKIDLPRYMLIPQSFN